MKFHLLNFVIGGLFLTSIIIYIYDLFFVLFNNKQDEPQIGFSYIIIFSVIITVIRLFAGREKITNKLVWFAVQFSLFFTWVFIAILIGALFVRVFVG